MKEIACVCSHPTYRYADLWKGETTWAESETKTCRFILKGYWTLMSSWDSNIYSFGVNWERRLPAIIFSPNGFSAYDTHQTAACLTVFCYLCWK